MNDADDQPATMTAREFLREHRAFMRSMRELVASRRPPRRRRAKAIQVLDLSALPPGTLSRRTVAALLAVHERTVPRIARVVGVAPGEQWTADNVQAANVAPGRRRSSKRKVAP